jgi:hypothetical protein
MPHQGVDPHRQDEEHHGDGTPVELVVGQDIGRRVADEHAEQRILDGHLDGEGEGAQGVLVGEELGDVAQGEMPRSVLQRVHHDQQERQHYEEHQKDEIRQRPTRPFVHFQSPVS